MALDEPLMTLAAVARETVRYGKAIFGGLTIDGTAAALQVSRDTVKRDWQWRSCGCFATWRRRKMSSDRWQRVENLCHAASRRSFHSRASEVGSHCSERATRRGAGDNLARQVHRIRVREKALRALQMIAAQFTAQSRQVSVFCRMPPVQKTVPSFAETMLEPKFPFDIYLQSAVRWPRG